MLAQSARYLDLVVKGGKLSFPLVGDVQILGLRNARTLIDSVAAGACPRTRRSAPPLQQVSRFAKLAGDNLDLSKPILASIGQPVQIKQTVISGSRTPLDQFAVAVAATLSLMLVTLLLAGGAAGARARGGHVSPGSCAASSRAATLLVEKIVLAAAAALVVTLLQLADREPVRRPRLERWAGSRRWPRARWRFAALGTALGALAREVRVASLLAILLALPLAFLALVPSGAVSPGALRHAQRGLRRVPVQADAARAGRPSTLALVHLLALAAVYGAIARLALRRF